MVITILNKRKTNEGEYVGRPSPLGNPWSITKEMNREQVIAKYKAWLELQWTTNNVRVKNELFRLASILKKQEHLKLLCWCAPKPCHAGLLEP